MTVITYFVSIYFVVKRTEFVNVRRGRGAEIEANCSAGSYPVHCVLCFPVRFDAAVHRCCSNVFGQSFGRNVSGLDTA